MIQIRNIYFVGSILMIVTMIANIWNLFVNWGVMNVAGRISFIFGSVLFQMLIAISFYVFYKITPKIPQIADVNENPQIKNILESFSKEFKKSNGGKSK